MNFTNFQKEIISYINKREIKDSVSFGKKYIKGINNDTDANIVQDSHQKTIQYFMLIQKLGLSGLIYVKNVENVNPGKIGFVFPVGFAHTANEVLVSEIYELINSNRFDELYPTEELILYEKRKFKTVEERDKKWITFRSIWVPIGVALFTVIVSSTVNYFIITNERQIIIKNTGAFKDTINVVIVDTFNNSFRKDTINIKSGILKDSINVVAKDTLTNN